jgi:hypothetical protein
LVISVQANWSKNMNRSAQDMVDAIITAGARRGSDGRGKDELDGRMFMLARTDHKSFGMLLERALRLKMKAKPDERDRAPLKKHFTVEEAKAELRSFGQPEEFVRLFDFCDPDDPPAEPPEDAGPNGTRDLLEAVVNAAIRHGSDGHGKDGLMGYMLAPERTAPTIYNRLMEIAQRWQVKNPSQSNRPDQHEPCPEEPCPTWEELIRARGLEEDPFFKSWLEEEEMSKQMDKQLEEEDRYGLRAKGLLPPVPKTPS